MYETVVNEHMPTAMNKATHSIWNKEFYWARKKFYFLKKMGRSGDRKQKIVLVRPKQLLLCKFFSPLETVL